MKPYDPAFAVGTRVRIASRDALARFRGSWKYHHPLQYDQLDWADRSAIVQNIGIYHGGDVLYTLGDVPGIWHEQCLLLEADVNDDKRR